MLTTFVRIIRPLFLFSVALLYILGVGMARYNGVIPNASMAILGLLWLMGLQIGALFLYTYFNNRLDSASTSQNKEDTNVRLPRVTWLLIAYAFLAVVASLSVLLIRVVEDPVVFFLMGAIAAGAISYSAFPIRLEYSGYGELLISLLVANLTPALGYLLQGGDSVRLLGMVTFPLTALHMAMLLAFSLTTYASDIKYNRRTLILRMGWQNGMLFHNMLVLCAYLILVLAMTFGLPWQIGAPALLTLPVGLFQIVNVNRIAAGVKPQWKSLTVMASAIFGITVYLLTFSFWIR